MSLFAFWSVFAEKPSHLSYTVSHNLDFVFTENTYLYSIFSVDC